MDHLLSLIEPARHWLTAHGIDPRIVLAAVPTVGGLVLHRLGIHKHIYRHYNRHRRRRRGYLER